MTRRLHHERRHSCRTRGLALVLALLLSPGIAGIAAAAAPTWVGSFTSAGLCSPRGIGLSPAGDVIVGSDCSAPHMARFTAAGGFVGTWSFPQGYLGSPNGIALDGWGDVFATDYDADRVYRFTSAGAMTGYWSSPGGPVDVAVSGLGEVFVASLIGSRVQKFTNDGYYLAMIGSAGAGPGQYQEPVGLTVDSDGRLYVADAGRARILRFRSNGTFDMEFTTPVPPSDVAVSPDGNIYVVSTSATNQVFQYSPGGALLLSFQSLNGLNGAFRIAISSTGAIYITEQYSTYRITKFQIDMSTSATRTTFGRLKALYR